MQFELNEDQALLRSSTRELLEKEAPLAEMRAVMEESAEGYSKAFFQQLGELGYPGLLLDEAQGGLGPIAYAVVLAEMGRVAFPGPFLDLAVAARTLAACDGEDAKSWADRTAGGESLVVLARAEDLGSADPAAPAATCSGGKVNGTKVFVPFGAHADALLVETVEGLALVERPGAGWNAQPLTTIDHAQRFASITLDDPGTLVADSAKSSALLADATRLGALGAAAEMFGLMERALEIAVGYTSERQAFGAPLGSFQALQHRAARLFTELELARSAVLAAARTVDTDPDQIPKMASLAKSVCSDTFVHVANEAIQMFGGVGMTDEYDIGFYIKRARACDVTFGDAAFHRARWAELHGY